MHVMIINGSPRAVKYSNTDKIIDAFARGLTKNNITFEKHAVSERNSWDKIRNSYMENQEIIIALPLYVECVPGLLLEFFETLPVKDAHTRISFILQGGFAEGIQLRCGEQFLENFTSYLGVRNGGVLCKGDNFGIRVTDEKGVDVITKPYEEMGEVFARGEGFRDEEAREFTGAEEFSLPTRFFYGMIFKTFAKKRFEEAARMHFNSVLPLDAKPYAS